VTAQAAVVIASNRGPVSFVRNEEGGFDIKRGAGGMAAALDPAARRMAHDAVWVCARTSAADREAIAAGGHEDLEGQLGYDVRFVDIDEDTYSRYYNQVSNKVLWFANHCLWDELTLDEFGERELDAFEEAYEPVNERFAAVVADIAAPHALVLLQDYHLYTAPEHLRKKRDDLTILHFTHSSFCGPEGLDRAPRPVPRRIVEGMLGADLLGFHVRAWGEGFFECCERLGATVDRTEWSVHHEGRRTWVRPYPIPVDPGDLRKQAKGQKAQRWARRFRDSSEGPLIVRSDRIEPAKNIVRGFEAFGRLLDKREDLDGEALFVACLYPSRQGLKEYRSYLEQVRLAAQKVNEKHPDSIELFLRDDFDRALGAYLVYDVLLVNSIMDGMNLVSKEGSALNQNDGVLVLSSGAGSFDELKDDAVLIEDPRNVEETVAALERAADMSAEERADRAARLKAKAAARSPRDWIEDQLADLDEVRAGRPPKTPAPPADG
jgi:trehalose 6-phosphate synthase